MSEQNIKNWFSRHPVWTTVIGIFILFMLIGIFGESSEEKQVASVPKKQVVDNKVVDLAKTENQVNTEDKELKVVTFTQVNDAKIVTQPVSNSIDQAPGVQINNEPSPKKVTDEANESELYSIVNVVDGDTVKINIDGNKETLRLIGMDTPETVDPRKPVQCFGTEASNKAKELLSGQKIRIEQDPTQSERDIYGRLLAYIYREDGLFFNKYMIEQGYAHEYTYNIPYKYQVEFKVAEKSARDNQLGLWSSDTCNGDTTSEIIDSTTSSQSTSQPVATESSTSKYYTSSYHTSNYYYPESCDGWKSLSEKYLVSYDSLEALLQDYSSKTLSPQCQ